MKMKTRYKRILGLFVLTFIILFSGTVSVFASQTCDELGKGPDVNGNYFMTKYGLSLDYDDAGHYVVKMKKNVKVDGVDSNAIKFKITKMGTYTLEDEETGKKDYTNSKFANNEADVKKYISDNTVAPGKEIKINRSDFANLSGFEVVLEPVGFEDPELKSCKLAGLQLIASYAVYGDPTEKTIESGVEDSISFSSSDQIDCSNYSGKFDHNSFEYKFCYAKEQAQRNNKAYDFGSVTKGNVNLSYENKWGKNDPFKFKCDYKTIFNSQEEKVLKDDTEYYKGSNTQYLYGKATFNVTKGNYVYNYEKGKKTEAAKCSIECEESVVVEYGPPVASKAGLCFQYKVRVTSRVSCQQKDGGITKPKNTKVCTPAPRCVHSTGHVYKQGGPSEDFDKCVKKCDGGKYTDKCVSKCYKNIYGNKKNAKKTGTTLALYDTIKIENEDTSTIMSAPKYEYDDGEIIWNTGQGSDNVRYGTAGCTGNPWPVATDSPWHKNNSWGCSACSKYTRYHYSGIPKTESCKDSCYWTGCTADNVYLNEKQAEMDKEYNEKIYQQLLEDCELAASCSSTTAEFAISVDYTMPGKSKQTTYFPYTSKNDKDTKDKLTSHTSENEGSITNTSKNDNTTILNYDGCYKESDARKYYQTEWTFPGTWINNKTHEISYVPIKSTGWRVEDDRFCLPLNLKDVNTKWWLYYFATLYKNDKTYAVNDSDYRSGTTECKESGSKTKSGTSGNSGSCNYGEATFTEDDAKDIDYNIHANTSRFGYFGWYINIDCFYSVYEAFDCSSNPNNKQGSGNNGTATNCKINGCCDKVTSDHRVRTVDLKNLFPAEDGSKLTSNDATGREPGFNWSKYAEQTTKDENYKSLPSKYTRWVQDKGYSVYSDEYLDYYIELTKEEINSIKKTGKNYTSWEGSTETNSVVNYKSDLIRKELKNAKYPNGQALKCNNMHNYASSQCENVEEVK